MAYLRDSEKRVLAAARWYVRCVEFGLRTDCSWFELREAVKVIAPEEINEIGESTYSQPTPGPAIGQAAPR